MDWLKDIVIVLVMFAILWALVALTWGTIGMFMVPCIGVMVGYNLALWAVAKDRRKVQGPTETKR